MKTMATCLLLASLIAACGGTTGAPLDLAALGYQACEEYFDCGTGRYCNPQGFCWADCRTSADCALVGPGLMCNLFGQCLEPGGTKSCGQHSDCPENTFCNGRCSGSGSVCGDDSECPPYFGMEQTCGGTCSPQCADDNDCLAFGDELECTPVGQCLLPGWERWIPPGELPPTTCKQDSHCWVRGFAWRCDCPKTLDPRSGLERCSGGAESQCIPTGEPLDFGDGPTSSPAHPLAGVWGMRMEIAVVTLGLPLVTKQNTYSSNLFLVHARHTTGDHLEMREKMCDLKLQNFIDSDQPFDDLAWMVIPARYMKAMSVLDRNVEVPSQAAGWHTSRSTEVRGCLLAEPATDPLPDRHVFDADPADERFWDQDEDGNVAVTTLMDGVLRGEIYNVQRWSATYDGEVLDSDHIWGLATIENEQLVISASNPTLVYDTETAIHVDPQRTYFRLERLADDASCADLIRRAGRQDAWLRHTPRLQDVGLP